MLVLPTTIYCEWTVPGAALLMSRLDLSRNIIRNTGDFLRPYCSPDGRRLYSWRVLILPYLEQKGLYDLFDRTAAWDSPHNRELLARRPSVYSILGAPAPSFDVRQVFIGRGQPLRAEGHDAR